MWETILHSNAFNFVIFVIIIAIICKKTDVAGMIAGLQEKVRQVIETAKKEREQALLKLEESEKAVANVENEVSTIMKDAEHTADVLSNKIKEDAQKQVENIKNNASKIIEAEEKVLHAKLLNKASKASLEVAEKHIKETLKENEALHERYINESINELDRLTL